MKASQLIKALEEGCVLKMNRWERYNSITPLLGQDTEFLVLKQDTQTKWIVLYSFNQINTTINRIEDILLNSKYWSVAFENQNEFFNFWKKKKEQKFKYEDTIIH